MTIRGLLYDMSSETIEEASAKTALPTQNKDTRETQEPLPMLTAYKRYVVESIKLHEADTDGDTEGNEDNVWNVEIIHRGFNVSKTRFYTDNALDDIVKLMEATNVQCFVNHDMWFYERSLQEMLGWYTDPVFDLKTGIVTAKFHLLETGPQVGVAEMIKEAAKRGNMEMVGLSISAIGTLADESDDTATNSEWYDVIDGVVDLISVDAVTRPGAGGKLNAMAESANDVMRKHYATVGKDEESTPNQKVTKVAEGEEGNMPDDNKDKDEEAMDDKEKDKDEESTDESESTQEMDKDDDDEKDKDMSKSSDEGENPFKKKDDDEEDDDKDKDEESRVAAESRKAKSKVKESVGMSNSTKTEKTIVESAQTKQLAEGLAAIKTMQMEKGQERLTAALATSKMGDPLKQDIAKQLENKMLDDAKITEAVARGEALWGEIQGSDAPVFKRGAVTKESQDTWAKRMDATLLGEGPDKEGNEPFDSMLEAYNALSNGQEQDPYGVITSESLATSLKSYASRPNGKPVSVAESTKRLAESRFVGINESVGYSTSWASAFGDALHRTMLYRYDSNEVYEWRSLVSQLKVSKDLKPEEFNRHGEYDKLSSVREGSPYQEVTFPTEDLITVRIRDKKIGNIQPVTIESFITDDMGALKDLPSKLADAFKREQFDRIWHDIVVANRTVQYGGGSNALFSSAHNNLGTAALSVDSLAAANTRMRRQKPLSNSDRSMGWRGKHLFVPAELEELAWRLVTSMYAIGGGNTSGSAGVGVGDATEPNIYKSLYGLDMRVIETFEDSNNWYLTTEIDPRAGKDTIAAVVYPNEKPMLTIQDDPTVGSRFTADVVSFKTVGWMTAEPLDHRTFQGNIVP